MSEHRHADSSAALTHYGDPALYSLGCSKSQDLVINDKSSQNNIIPERLVNL